MRELLNRRRRVSISHIDIFVIPHIDMHARAKVCVMQNPARAKVTAQPLGRTSAVYATDVRKQRSIGSVDYGHSASGCELLTSKVGLIDGQLHAIGSIDDEALGLTFQSALQLEHASVRREGPFECRATPCKLGGRIPVDLSPAAPRRGTHDNRGHGVIHVISERERLYT